MSELIAAAQESYPDDTDAVIAQAVADGFVVTIAAGSVLQVDIDSDADYMAFQSLWGMFADITGGQVKLIVPSRSGLPKRHITITLPYEVDDITRLALQAILRSDPRRELFGYRRVRDGIAPVTVFIDKPTP
jgi:hypothetical protein